MSGGLTIELWPCYLTLALLLNGGLIAQQEPPEAALVADKTSVVPAEKTPVASRAKTHVAAAEKTPDISISSTTPWGAEGAPPGCRRFH